MLAAQLVKKYRYENCAVVALNDGGVVVGAQISSQLHSVLMMLQTAEIHLPMEPEAFAGISQTGSFAYNTAYSEGEIEELNADYYHFVEQEKMSKMQDMQRLIGDGGMISKDLLRGRTIILVSDGFASAFSIDIAMEYLKPVQMEKLIIATPLSSLKAVDRMHMIADEIYCLSVIEDYMWTDHYYDMNDVPDHSKIIEIIEKIILEWK